MMLPGRREYQLDELRTIYMANGPSEHVVSSLSLKKYYQTQKLQDSCYFKKVDVVVTAYEKLVG